MSGSDDPGNLTRRRVLHVAGAGTLGTFGVGSAAARPDRYIVGTRSRAAERAARSRADTVHRVLDFGDIGKAVAGRFSPQALQALQNRADVRYVEVDGTMEAINIDSGDSEVPWGVDRVDAEKAHADGYTGSGADVAIIDSGIDSDHPDLQANLGAGKAFVKAKGPYAKDWDDDNGHGTHCAGIADAVDNGAGVVGVSTQATLHAVKVLADDGSGSFSDVAAGIEYVADQGWDVGSLSLGASSGSQTVKDACTYAYGNGVLLVGAAGNAGPCSDCVGYPAAYSEVIAVSATNDKDKLARYSSTGPEIELAAPGTDIYSTYVGGGYETYSGTSMACPHVAGAAGQLMADGYANTDARGQLASAAEDIGLAANEGGAGLLDVEAALGGSTDTESAPTVDSLTMSEVETSDSSAAFDVSWQVSDADGNLSSVGLVLTQDSDGTTEDSATVSVSGDTASDTTRLVAADDDGSGNSYTVTLTVADGAGNSATESATATESEPDTTESAPAIDSYTVTEAGSPNPHAQITAEWAVSDSDGDLSSVVVDVRSGGSVVDSATHAVSGSSASGSASFEIKHARGQQFDVVLTVTDSQSNTASGTKTVSE